MVIEVAQEIGSAPFTAVVRDDGSCSDDKYDRADSHSRPGLIHVSLHGYARTQPPAAGNTHHEYSRLGLQAVHGWPAVRAPWRTPAGQRRRPM